MKKTRIRLSLFSLVLALVLFGLTICATGREPFSVYWSILAGSFGSTKSFLNVLAYTLPLIMTGLGAAVAFQSGVFNIGGEVHTDNDTVLLCHGKIFHYSHETRWIPRLPLCRWSPVRYIHGSLF